ncbi:MAG TPA: hypothetical protein VI298_12925 [Geobacteraceae bacterium]
MAENPARIQEIACQQVLRGDSSVFSAQWLTLHPRHAGAVAPERLLERYLAHVRRVTCSLVRPARSAEGIDFRLLATRLNLLSFGTPGVAHEGMTSSVTLRISGGCLVQPRECGRGELSFIAEPHGEGIKVEVRIAGYCPLLLGSRRPSRGRKLLYRLTQALLHKVVTVGFLVRLYREREGRARRVRVVRVGGDGENI